MKIAGIILLVLQAVAVFGTISSGGAFPMNIAGLIGYFLPAIIGVFLLIKAGTKKAKEEEKKDAE